MDNQTVYTVTSQTCSEGVSKIDVSVFKSKDDATAYLLTEREADLAWLGFLAATSEIYKMPDDESDESPEIKPGTLVVVSDTDTVFEGYIQDETPEVSAWIKLEETVVL